MKKMMTITLCVILGLLTAGCNTSYKSEICLIQSDKETNICKDGQIALFLPQQWGNPQIPLSVSAAICDFNFPIVQNESGVTCVFKKRNTTTK